MTPTNDFFNKLEGIWQNKINGEWQNHFGWNVVIQPKLNDPNTNDFNIRVDQMRETITFKRIGSARNIGITGEAGFWQSMSYEIDIKTPEDVGIHHEMGHFLLKVQEDGSTFENLIAPIIRQGTIPRANSFMTHGNLFIGAINQAIASQSEPFYSSRPIVENQVLQNEIDTKLSEIQEKVSDKSGPILTQPLEWLANILTNTVVGTDWVFSFRDDTNQSQMASGQRVVNPVTIGNLLSDFWIGDRSTENGTLELLQYAQKVNLNFNGEEWPHVAVNSLIKQ